MASLVFHWQDIWVGRSLLAQGLLYTVLLSVSSFTIAFILGTVLGLLRAEIKGWPGRLAALYIEFLRGIPLILFLIFIHYGLMPLVLGRSNFLLSSWLTFVLFEAAYVGEIIRGGLRSVSLAEREAAISLGLSRWQQIREVLLPLTMARMAPALVGQFVSLIKDTSLAAVVGVIELTRAGEIIYEQRFHDLEILLFQALVYFALCFSVSLLGRRFESPTRKAENVLARTISD
ncbi:amino acid ABC transporter permease [Vampirovibrio sp.]|uniref:amino acid ABC transporter permease n=1 Tax=Vampirovibrio sp. TaxID=2717857 RepID=UPI0035942244